MAAHVVLEMVRLISQGLMQQANPFNPYWYRVAALKPKLRSHVQLHWHQYRGQSWYILQDDSSGRFHRFSPSAYKVIARMDGEQTLDDIWHYASHELGDQEITQSELLTLVGQLYKADAFVTELPADSKELFERQSTTQRKMRIQRWKSPLAVKIPLFDPDKFIVKTLPYVSWLFGKWGMSLWLLVVGGALLTAAMNWSALTSNLVDRILAGQNIWVLILTFPIVKLVHEFGHAYAARSRGGEVHEMGIMILILMPIPYVDATCATAFASRWERVLVGAAGMLVELFLAALALYLWVDIESGFVSAVLYNVMIIAGISTILFNANPLIRFDGYYILSDWIEVPNLGTRSTKYLGYLIQRHLFKLNNVKNPASNDGEKRWFIFYGIASFIYRIFLISFIVFLLAGNYFVFGVLLAVWAVFMMAVMPIYKQLKFLISDKKLEGNRPRAISIAALATTFLALILMLPLPLATVAEGVVWANPESRVRMGGQGFVVEQLKFDGDLVKKGDVIARCENIELTTSRSRLQAQLAEFDAQYQAISASGQENRAQLNLVREQLVATQAKLDTVQLQIEKLNILSPRDGRFVESSSIDPTGYFLHRGDLLGFVVKDDEATARIIVPQERIHLVRQKTQEIEVRVIQSLDKVLPAKVIRETPRATQDIPSTALAYEGGGSVVANPNQGGQVDSGLATFDNWFQIDLLIAASEDSLGMGERVYARFDHGREMLGVQIYRVVRSTFLDKFGI